jgi:hypothetical protein
MVFAWNVCVKMTEQHATLANLAEKHLPADASQSNLGDLPNLKRHLQEWLVQ